MHSPARTALEDFFLLGEVPHNVESGIYVIPLVILSYVVASMGSFAGLRFATDIQTASSKKIKQYLHVGGAFAFGTGIWSMHFIGMLAYDIDMVHTYDVLLTVLSMIIAVGIAYGVLQIIRVGRLTIPKLTFGALLLGTAICAMHYVGMAAMQMDADLRYVPSFFALSFLIAVTASAAALWIIFTLGRHDSKWKVWWQILAALVMGAAICGMHYTGMEAAVFIPYADCRYDPDQEFVALALTVSVVSSAIFAVAIVLSLVKAPQETNGKFKNTYSGNRVFLQLSLLLSTFLMLLVGSYVFLIKDSEDQEGISVILNASGLQRMFIVRYTQNVSAKRHQQSALDQSLIDTNFKSFLEGGNLILSVDGSKVQEVSAFKNAEFKVALRTARSEWNNLKAIAGKFVGGSSNIKELSDQSTITLLAQDALTSAAQNNLYRQAQSIIFKQELIIGLGFLIFITTVLYARFFIANPIEKAGSALKASRQNLAQRVQEQTQDLHKAKEQAERLNEQMQVYTDKLEESRLEQMETHHKLAHEAKTVKLFEQVSTAINLADSTDEAIYICLHEICIYTGWSVGHIYYYKEDEGLLIPQKIWHLQEAEKFQEFKEITEKTTFLPGVGLPGRVYESGQSVWVSDLTTDLNSPRLAMLDEIVVKAGIGVPVLVKEDVVAVLEFYNKKVTELDEDLLRVLSNIGMQLGRIMERDQMLQARRDAEAANEAKGEFLANMSHELRTPLNSIIGLSSMLIDDAAEASEEQDMNRTVHRSANNLLEIVNDILDLSKIEAGSILLEHIGFDLKDTVRNTVDTLAPIASSKGVSLNYSYKEKTIPYLIGDPLRVGRILTNLVSNAVKYTHEGSVDIVVGCDEIEENRVAINCSITDSGIGIPEEKLPIIFDKFSQADETTTRKYGGTGLGLSITKELIDLMGGIIGVESTVGEGSSFYFTIPFDTTAELHDELRSRPTNIVPGEEARERAAVDTARLLVAEDNELNQMFIKKLLGRVGFQYFDIVESGVEAVQAFQEHDYDLILMDCHMPEMNGYQATREIRKLEGDIPTPIPVLALTADAMVGTREKCLEAGMSDYITKPIDSETFKTVLSRWFALSDTQSISRETTIHEQDKFNVSALHDFAETLEEMQAMCATFFEGAEEAIDILRDQCVDGDNSQWVETSHKIKGSAGMIGALELQHYCAEAQHMEVATKLERGEILSTIEASYSRAHRFFENFLNEQEALQGTTQEKC